jgi:hypothetical protein
MARSRNYPVCKNSYIGEMWKIDSPTGVEPSYAQHDLTLTVRNSFEIFYARDARLSFHTAKTHLGHQPTPQ